MKDRIAFVHALSILACLITAGTALYIWLSDFGPVLNILGGLSGFVFGSALATLWFVRIQTREAGSALSVALNRSQIASRLEIGTIGAGFLISSARSSPTLAKDLITTVETLAVRHRDQLRLKVSKDERGDMTGTDIGIEVEDGAQGAMRNRGVATDGHAVVVRDGGPDDDHALIDGPYRLLILRNEIPDSTRRALVAKVRQGPFPLEQVVIISGLNEGCTVVDIHLAENEIHFLLEPNLVKWTDVRRQIDPTFCDDSELPATKRGIKIARSLWGFR